MTVFHILSLDGGGIRGVLTAALLERLEQSNPGFMSRVDLLAGTSTGEILALGLASGMTPSEVRSLYERLGASVFSDSIWDNLIDLGQVRGAQYSNKKLKEELTNQFGSMKLADLPYSAGAQNRQTKTARSARPIRRDRLQSQIPACPG